IEISELLRLEQVHFASTLVLVSADAIVSCAGFTDRRLADGDLQRRDERVDEMKLADRADVFAEARAFEQKVDGDGRGEIADDDPGGGAGAIPKRESFVGPEIDDEQGRGDPFRAEPGRPAKSRSDEFARQVAGERKGACHAKQISGEKERDDGE